jgi:glycosyltransferase involved in cell wall biosynthesis
MYGWEFPPHNSGGLGTACIGLVKGLVKEGVDLRFVLPRKYPVEETGATMLFADEANPLNGEQAEKFTSGYINEDQLKFLKGEYPDLQYGPSLYDEVLRYAALSPLIALQNMPDVIHAHDWLCYPAGIAAKRATGVPLVIHVHATEFDRTGKYDANNPIVDIERRGFYEADKILTVSEHTKNIIINYYGADPNKIEAIYNGVDPEGSNILPYGEGENKVDRLKREGWGIVLFVGRITIQKGPDYYLEAAKKVLEHNPKTLFVVAGSGDMEKQIIDRAAYLGIGDKVIFTGFKRDRELAHLFKAADLLVMPSVSEPFGIVPLESLINGTPVLISKQSGVSEVLKNALKVDFWDINDMTNKILSALMHPSLCETLKQEGEREARAQTWSKIAQRCMMVYKKLLSSLSRV